MDLESKKVYGYDYDIESNSYKINEKEEKNVKNIHYLYSAGFIPKEIADIMNGLSIYSIVSNKIFHLIENIQSYDKSIGNYFIENGDYKINIESILKEKGNIDNVLLSPLKKIQNEINKNNDIKSLYYNDVIKIIEIINNIENIKETINNIWFKWDYQFW